MANRFFSLQRGDDGHLVVEGASTSGGNVELRVDDAVSLTKLQVRLLVLKIIEHIDEVNDTIPSTSNT